MNAKVLEYYRKIIALYQIDTSAIAATALEFLVRTLPNVAPDYLKRQPWENLVIGLYLNGVQLCGGCLLVASLNDFKRTLDVRNKCRRCQTASKIAKEKRRAIAAKARYDARKGLAKVIDALPGSAGVKRKLKSDFGIKPNLKYLNTIPLIRRTDAAARRLLGVK